MHAESSATTSWDGTLADGSGLTSLASGAAAPLKVSWATRAERSAGTTSPEELIAAAHASCFAMAFSHELGEAGATPEHLDVSATVTFEIVNDAPTVSRSALTVRGIGQRHRRRRLQARGGGRQGRLSRLACACRRRRDHDRRGARLTQSRGRAQGATGRASKPARVSDHWETNRTEAFSDGVFAIAITLLVLDIRIPATEFSDPWTALAHEWPAYLGFATSFVTIGGIWLIHHGMFRRLQYADTRIMRLNLLLLMAVSWLPFPTRFMAEAMRATEAERAAVIVYGASLLLISAIISGMWGAIALDRRLLKPDVSDAEIKLILRQSTPNLGFYVSLTALALFLPRAAAAGYLVVAVVAVLRARGDNFAVAETDTA